MKLVESGRSGKLGKSGKLEEVGKFWLWPVMQLVELDKRDDEKIPRIKKWPPMGIYSSSF